VRIPKRFAMAWLLGTLLLHLAAAADLAPASPEPLRIEGLLRPGPGVNFNDREISISASLVLGMIAFNSPYILGGDALRNGLTCNACHSPNGPSGSASTMTLTKPLPNLLHSQSQGHPTAPAEIGIARFIRAALPREFQSKDVPEDIVVGLSVYLAGWKAPAIGDRSVTAPLLHIGPWAMVSLGAQLAKHSICANDSIRAELVIETVRFYLGAIDAQMTDQAIKDEVRSLNRSLHAADDDLLGNRVLSTLSTVSSIESGLAAKSPAGFILRLEPELGWRPNRDQNAANPNQLPEELRVPCTAQDSQL
jgi:hypothetical protein